MFKKLLAMVPQPYASYLSLLPYVIAAAIGFYAAWYIQGIRIDRLNVKIERLQDDNTKCHNGLNEEKKTVEALKDEVKVNAEICSKTSKIKEAEIVRLRRLCGGTPTIPGSSNSDGSVLGELNSLY